MGQPVGSFAISGYHHVISGLCRRVSHPTDCLGNFSLKTPSSRTPSLQAPTASSLPRINTTNKPIQWPSYRKSCQHAFSLMDIWNGKGRARGGIIARAYRLRKESTTPNFDIGENALRRQHVATSMQTIFEAKEDRIAQRTGRPRDC